MIIGIAFMTARYAAFWFGSANDNHIFYIVGILFHGLIFGLFFISGQIYTDKKAPEHLRAQAQGLIAFLVWGVALLLGNLLCSYLLKCNKSVDSAGEIFYNWRSIFGIATLYSLLVLIVFMLFFKNEK